MSDKPPCRELDYHDWDDLLRDLDTLQRQGYDKAGNWSLGQVCAHLNDWMRFPLDGFPKPPFPVRVLLWTLKTTIGKSQLRKILTTRRMPQNGPTMRETVHAPETDEAKAVDDLRATIARFRADEAPLHPSPLFGEMDRAMWTQLQLVHCAHHLRFLIPRGAGG